MAALIRFNNQTIIRNLISNAVRNSRLISTSQKNRETATAAVSPSKTETQSSVATDKNWVSYGFEFKDQAADRSSMKGSFFFSVTLCLVWGTFVWSYLPDTQMRDWAQREGYLELRRREAAGVEPINKEYVDVSSIQLPEDSDLGNTEIII